MPAKGPVPARRMRKRWLATGILTAATIGTLAYVFWQRARPPVLPPTTVVPPPALTTSPYLNTRQGVAYVGDERCAACHTAQEEAYRQHPMGRSLFRAADAPPPDHFSVPASNSFQAGSFRFEVLRDGPRLIHREWCQDAHGNVVAELQKEITYAVGSGSQGRSYLFGPKGFLFESPITWYRQDSRWQLSPGYAETPLHFSRRVDARCLSCHSQEVRPVAHSINRYQEPPFGQLAIGCERCHGPGELHVAARKQGAPPDDGDFTIVNPRRLTPELREAVCEQCHLQGEVILPRRGRAQTDYRPGLPLQEYVSFFIRPPEVHDARRIVGHVEQMHESACFEKSNGKFGCISCHDPHWSPPLDRKLAFYEDRCRNCHGQARQGEVKARDCSVALAERMAPDGRKDCLACHMPRGTSSTASHLAVTDHRLLRRPDRPRTPRSAFRSGDIPLVPFHRDPRNGVEAEARRDLAVAAVQLAENARSTGAPPQVADYLLQRALPILDEAVARTSDDVMAIEARGFALFNQRRFDDAQQALAEALALAPDREQTLSWAVPVAVARNRLDLAENYSRRLVELNPEFPWYRETLAGILLKRKAWSEARDTAAAAVRANPFRPQARSLLISALLRTGDPVQARREFEILGVIDARFQEQFRPRFEEQLREAK